MKRKLLSILLTFCLAFSLLPTAALAEGPADPVAQIGNAKYETLAAAFDAAKDGDTITLLKSGNGNGVSVPANKFTNKGVTLNFNGYTYMVGGQLVGSPGTGTNAFQLKAGNKLTFKNGSIVGATEGSKPADDTPNWHGAPAIVIQNYCDLTLDNMTVTGGDETVYTMSNNCGNVVIKDTVINPGMAKGYGYGPYAFDVYGGFQSYGDVTVTVEGVSVINGNIEIDHGTDNSNVNTLIVKAGTVNGNIKKTNGNLTITGGIFTSDVSAYLAEGYTTNEINGKKVVVADTAEPVAKTGDYSYSSVQNAVNAAALASESTVTLLKDTNENVTISGVEITLDLAGKTLTIPSDCGVTIHGTGSKLTVTGSGTVTCSKTPFMVNEGALVIENGSVTSETDYGIYALNGGSVTVNGGTLTSTDAVLTGNNLTGNMNFTVNGGTLTAKQGPAIYMPGQVELTITGGTLNGGISLRMGQVNISGGTINAITQDIDSPTNYYNYSGNAWLPDALYVFGGTYTSEDSYGNSLNLNITGGTFTCANDQGSAVAIYDLGKVEQEMNVTISGEAKLSTNGTSRGAYDVLSLTDIGVTNPATGFGVNSGNVNTAISSGLFSSDVTKYCAEGLMAVANKDSATNTTYPYTIGEVPDAAIDMTITEHTQAGETDGSVSNSVTDKTAAEAVARSVTTDVVSTANDIEITDTEKKTAIQQLLADNQIELNADGTVKGDSVTITIIKQPYLDVEVTALDSTAKELSLTIEPKYNLLATTDKNNPSKSVVVSTGNALTVTGEMEVKLALPDDFAAADAKLSIKHTKDNGTVEYYTGTVSVENGNLYVTFTTKGFSPFTISAPAASIGETMYPTLAEAIAKAANGNIVNLEKSCTESVTVSGKSLTIDKKSHEYNFDKVTVDSNSTKTVSGDGKILTITYTAPSYSSGSSSYDPTYSVSTPSKTEHGTVTVSPKNASKGDRVTVTVKPDSGYVLETLTVTDKNGNELTLKDKGNGKYTFTMPAGKVEVKATFMEDNSMLNFFYDVPNNAYFYEAVKWAVKNGITDGVGDNLFAPEQPCTRAQIVTFLWRAAGSPEPKGAASGMTDVVSGSYYEKAVAWAIENGITTGTTTTTFSPDVTCTRAQAVTFLARALKAKAASAAEFSDVPTGSYFADAVAWAAANGVTEGIGGGLFGSDNDCTRGQIVTFLYRAYNK